MTSAHLRPHLGLRLGVEVNAQSPEGEPVSQGRRPASVFPSEDWEWKALTRQWTQAEADLESCNPTLCISVSPPSLQPSIHPSSVVFHLSVGLGVIQSAVDPSPGPGQLIVDL